MKNTFIIILALCLSTLAVAQTTTVFTRDNNYGFGSGFLSKDALEYLIPAIEVPSATPSTRDSLFYFEGLKIRKEDQERFQMAARDAVWSIEIISSFSDAVGVELSAQNTPELWYLLSEAIQDTDNLVVAIKARHYRMRPYVRWKEVDDGVADRDRLANTSSSPSGHSGLASTIMCILLEVFPSKAPSIISRSNDFINARWILGFHYKSDCELGQQIGGFVINILHGHPGFQAQLGRAKEEAFRLSRANHPCFAGIEKAINE